MGRRGQKKSVIPWKRKKLRRQKISIKQWDKMDFTLNEFSKWGINFRLLFSQRAIQPELLRKKIAKHNYSFDKLSEEHPEIVDNALEIVKAWENSEPKGLEIDAFRKAIREGNKLAEKLYTEKRENWMKDLKPNVMPVLYEVYKILRKKGFTNLELCGFIPTKERRKLS